MSKITIEVSNFDFDVLENSEIFTNLYIEFAVWLTNQNENHVNSVAPLLWTQMPDVQLILVFEVQIV